MAPNVSAAKKAWFKLFACWGWLRLEISIMQNMSQVVDRYAGALFELASEQRLLPTLFGQTNMLAPQLAESGAILAYLSNPTVGKNVRVKAAESLGKKLKLHPLLIQTMQLMTRKFRSNLIVPVLKRFNALYAMHEGQQIAEVTSAVPLTSTQKENVRDSLRKLVGQTTQLEEKVDESLLGGIRIRLGSWLIDDSLAARLRRLERQLLKAA